MALPSTLSRVRKLVYSKITSLLRKFVITKFSDTDNTIYLTFDDGPCDNTETIFKTLNDMGVKAGFFFNGDAVVRYKELVKRIYLDGYYVGNHSYYHTKYTWMQWLQEIVSISKGAEIISALTCGNSNFYRPPFGKIRPITLIYLLITMRKIVLWSVDSKDFEATDISEIINNIHDISSGDILLFHSDCDLTATHLHIIINELSAKGYRFGNLSAVLE